MVELTAEQFPDFFEQIRGHEPFQWQYDFVVHLLEQGPPDRIDVPTGMGKTSVLDCWAFALAASADRKEDRLPLRLFFVVDRRLVVDSAHEDAIDLQTTLRTGVGPAGLVAERLGGLAGGADPIDVVRMRGGVSWDSRWLDRPDQPGIVVGTVDQYGSRLLFRGYGTSRNSRSIDAALTGTDAWLVIDEAHIADPLAQTAEAVARHHTETPGQWPGHGLRVTSMTATGRSDGVVFRAEPGAQRNSGRFPESALAAARRLDAQKPVSLVDLTYLASGTRKTWRRNARQLGVQLADLATRLDGGPRVIGVIANTIATARAAHDELIDRNADALLMIGRVRGHERDQLVENDLRRALVGAEAPSETLYVVATQTIEVGANLDFDAVVTECAPLSSLIQRFGRVNRVGARERSRSVVVHAGFAHGEDDPVYGLATAATWTYLVDQAASPPLALAKAKADPQWSGQHLDLGLLPARILAAGAPHDIAVTAGAVPMALGVHFDRWAQTAPAPFPDQPVAPFLHGVQRTTADVEVAWRIPPTITSDADAWMTWLAVSPPVQWEFVSVPIWEARGLLAGITPQSSTGDVETTAEIEEEEIEAPEGDLPVIGVVLGGRDDSARLIRRPADIAVGDRIVLDSAVGGHDRWGWTGTRDETAFQAVKDVGDLAPARLGTILRLVPALIVQHSSMSEATVKELFADLKGEPDNPIAAAASLLAALAHHPDIDEPFRDAVRRFRERSERASGGSRMVATPSRDDAADPPLTQPFGTIVSLPTGRAALDSVEDGNVESSSQVGQKQVLSEHCDEVGELAARFANNLGLSDPLIRAVRLAGRLHDLGKADGRFQIMLHDGDEMSAAAAEEPLAKSGRDTRDPVARRARVVAGLPKGFRHEAVSARLLDELDLGPHDVDGALVRHLVVSHHGFARPLLSPLIDDTAAEVKVSFDDVVVAVPGAHSQVDWQQPARFTQLQRTYGWWGLALLETIVRLADIRCSKGETS